MILTRCRPLVALVILTALLPCLAQERTFYFILLSDPQFGMYSDNKGFEQETANYEFAIASVNRLKPGFVIVAGDLVNKPGDPGQTAEYLRISSKINPSIPLYHIPGNHDIGNEPTPDSLAAYRERFGPLCYSFRAGPVYGIVLNSTLIHAPKGAPDDYEEQEAWLKKELEIARSSGAPQIIVFQHHPYFVKDASEADQYFNIPSELRRRYLDWFKSYGVRYVFAGHHHQNGLAKDGELEMVTSGPVGKPLGQGRSGIRVVAVKDSLLKHRFFDFSALPHGLTDLEK